MKVIVLMGGDSSEREVSLVTGDQIAAALSANGHEVIKIDPSATRSEQTELNQTDHHWIGIDYPDYDLLPMHRGSLYLKNLLISKRLKPDVVFNALHGGKGENGIVQGMLDSAGIPYTGSGRIASTLAMEKDISKQFFRTAHLPVPKGVALNRPGASRKAVKQLPLPLVVKPNDQGSTIGLEIVSKPERLEPALEQAFKYSNKVIVEEYIPGREITVGIIKTRTLPVLEIIPEHDSYDYECKYKDGMSRYQVPAELPLPVTQKLQTLALKAHRVLGCSGYSRVDFRLNEADQPFILEVNTLPGMTGTSLLPKAAKAADIHFNALVEMIVEEALK